MTKLLAFQQRVRLGVLRRLVASRTVPVRGQEILDDPGAQTFGYYPADRPRSQTVRHHGDEVAETITNCYDGAGGVPHDYDINPRRLTSPLCVGPAAGLRRPHH